MGLSCLGFSYLHGSVIFVSYAKWKEFSGIISSNPLSAHTLALLSDSDDTDVESFLLPRSSEALFIYFLPVFLSVIYMDEFYYSVFKFTDSSVREVFPYCFLEGLPGVR